MTTVIFIRYQRQPRSALNGVSDYVKQTEKTMGEDGAQLISGQNCSPQFSAQEFLATRHLHRKDSPVWFALYRVMSTQTEFLRTLYPPKNRIRLRGHSRNWRGM